MPQPAVGMTAGLLAGNGATLPDGRLAGRNSRGDMARVRAWITWQRAGWLGWLGLIAGVSVLVVMAPEARTVVPSYREAALAWWHGRDLYSQGIHGFLYLPSSAVLFAPFAAAGVPVGDLLWRWASAAVFTAGLAGLCRLAVPNAPGRGLGLVLLAILPAVGPAVQNGQSDLAMAGLMMLAVAALSGRRWGAAGLCLAGAVAVKPLAIVLALLAAALYRPVRAWLVLGLVLGLLLPFLHPDPAYVLDQYHAALVKLLNAADPGGGRWSDLTGLLGRLGLSVPEGVMTAVRVAAALATLALAAAAVRRHPAGRAGFLLYALAATYLMLFNPRTETSSYGMLAAAIAPLAAAAWLEERRAGLALALIGLCLGLGVQAYGQAVYSATDLWFKPAVAAVFAVILVRRALGPWPDAATGRPVPSSPS